MRVKEWFITVLIGCFLAVAAPVAADEAVSPVPADGAALSDGAQGGSVSGAPKKKKKKKRRSRRKKAKKVATAPAAGDAQKPAAEGSSY